MQPGRWISALTVAFVLAGPLTDLAAQGQGKGREGEKKVAQSQSKGQKKDAAQAQRSVKPARQDRGPERNARAKPQQTRKADARAAKADERGARGKSAVRTVDRGNVDRGARGVFKHDVALKDMRSNMRRHAASGRAPQRVAAGAVARAVARGMDDNAFIIQPAADRVFIRNSSGLLLLDIDEDRARNLGHWNVVPLRDDRGSGGPAFCRSGAGHPVWGRQWCYDKGFGLGRSRDIWWGETRDVRDIIFARRLDSGTLVRDMLVATLGNVVLDRLGLHAITMGYSEPLTGVWIGEPTGPRVLQVYSSSYPVAEIVDIDRDDRADVMLVALRPW